MQQGAGISLKKRSGAEVFNKFKNNPPEIVSGSKLRRPGVNVSGSLMSQRSMPNKDGKSFTLRLSIHLDSYFDPADVPADAGVFISKTKIGIYVQHQHELTEAYKKECKEKGIKVNSTKYTNPEILGELVYLNWDTSFEIGIYNGMAMNKTIKIGDHVTLRGLYFNHMHNKEKGDMASYGVTGIEKGRPSGLSNFNFTSLAGHVRNRMIKLEIDPTRLELEDPEVANMSEADKAKDWVKEKNMIYRMGTEARTAAEAIYIFPLRDCTPESELGQKLGNYIRIKEWLINKKNDEKAKRDVISTGNVHMYQVAETADKHVVGVFSVLLWADDLRGTVPIGNYEHLDLLKELLRVAHGAIFAKPNVLAESEVGDDEVDFQINCLAKRVQIDLPRAIMEQGMEIPVGISSTLLATATAAQEYFGEEKVNKDSLGRNSKVINLCETKNSPPPGYVLFLVSTETVAELSKKGDYVPSRFRAFIDSLTPEERTSYWPFWAGVADSCEVRAEFEEKSTFFGFKPAVKFIIFAVQQAEVDRVRKTPNFPSVEEAIKIYDEIKAAEEEKVQQEEAAFNAAADNAAAIAEAAYLKRKAEEAEQESKRQKVSSDQDNDSDE